MSAKTLMIQGTSSDAGKSLMVTGLCRLLARRGVKVAPFKPQNMALNSAVTPCGGEIGRAQAVQAMAAGQELQVHFNPVLLKPCTDTGAQVIIHGNALSNLAAAQYFDSKYGHKKVAMDAVLKSHQILSEQFDCIVVEGAGSPAEINLRQGDIANMGFAEAVNCPVILVADIDRGGVFAQIVGTMALLSPSEQQRVVGFIINKFRGDISLLQSGLDWLEQRCQRPVLGVLPYIHGLDVASEDAIESKQNLTEVKFTVCVPVLSRTSNHTDFDSLRAHPNIDLQFVAAPKPIPACDLIMIPGSKNVIDDLHFMMSHQWDKQIKRHLRFGGKVLGICGGYQILGKSIADPYGVENSVESQAPQPVSGLGLLPIVTELQQHKTLTQVCGEMTLSGEKAQISGYEIHVGLSHSSSQQIHHFITVNGQSAGIIDGDDQVAGTYLHGLFDTPAALVLIAKWCGIDITPTLNETQRQQQAIDKLADAMAQHLDINRIFTHFGESQDDRQK